MNAIRPIIFGVVMLLYLWYPYTIIKGQEQILREGISYRFKPIPIDPVDAFRGKFVVLNYEGLNRKYTNAEETFQRGQMLYLTIAKDDKGYAHFSEVLTTAPESGDYLSTTCLDLSNNEIRLKVPKNMERYFLNESIAPEAERFYNQLNSQNADADSIFMYVDTKVKNGKILLEQLYFKDQTVEDYIRNRIVNK